MLRGWGRRLARAGWAVPLLFCGLGASVPAARAVSRPSAITIYTDELASDAPFMGVGVELDPYDSFEPTGVQWSLVFQRLDYMRPGFLRVVEPASDYFGGYDAFGNPVYRWGAPHVVQLLKILDYARSRSIPVVLGDWSNPLIGGDPRIPAEFLRQLHDVYGYTNIRYYSLISEPNYSSGCDFGCWTRIVETLSREFRALGMDSWLTLVGPDNGNSWDDTAAAQALDRASGLDTDNPIGGDSWVTATLRAIPGLIGAYDSHRYATIWGIENGVYADQMRARRELISNLDSPSKPYFAGEVGLTARQVSPFTRRLSPRSRRALVPLLDPGAMPRAGSFVDSQPQIAEFDYGVWMGDMMIQAIGAGLAGASAWELDDAMHVGGQYGAENLKRWGFWNSLGGQDGYPASDLSLRPWFYAWSVLARAFPAASQPLLVPSTGVPGLRVTAARIANGSRFDLSLAVVNDSDTPRSITLTVPSVTGALTLARYDYFSGQQTVDADGFAVPDQTLVDQPSAGVNVSLPSRGLVVLTSRGFGGPVVLNQGTTTLLDNLQNWQHTYAHTSGLEFDHSNPAQFNYASSRVTLSPPPEPKTKTKGKGKSRSTPKRPPPQFLAYRLSQVTSFGVKVYSQTATKVSIYGSEDGSVWAPIALASRDPAPAVGGQQMLSQLLPALALPAGVNRVKIVLGPGTEVAQVAITGGRSGPACLARTPAARANSLAGLLPGTSPGAVLGSIGPASSRSRFVWRYCVASAGQLAVVFPRRGGASLLATTAPGYQVGGIHPGASRSAVQRRYGRARLRTVGGRLLVTPAGQVFIVRSGRVTAVALVARSVLAKAGALQAAARLASLG